MCTMIVTIVHVHVKPEHIEEFIQLTEKNHKQSVQEPGNLHFDILQREDNPAKFALYEAYESQEAAAAHKETSHYFEWKEAVAPWMAEPRKGIKYKGLYPER